MFIYVLYSTIRYYVFGYGMWIVECVFGRVIGVFSDGDGLIFGGLFGMVGVL